VRDTRRRVNENTRAGNGKRTPESLAQETENTHKNQIKLQAVEEKYAQQTIEWNGKIELLEFEIEEIKVNETRKIDVLKEENSDTFWRNAWRKTWRKE